MPRPRRRAARTLAQVFDAEARQKKRRTQQERAAAQAAAALARHHAAGLAAARRTHGALLDRIATTPGAPDTGGPIIRAVRASRDLQSLCERLDRFASRHPDRTRRPILLPWQLLPPPP